MRFAGEYLLLSRRVMYVGILLLFYVVLPACFPLPTIQVPTPLPTIASDTGNIIVNVFDENDKPLSEGVIVRVSGSPSSDGYDNNEFRVGPCNQGQYIAVWAPGHETEYQTCDGITTIYPVKLRFPLNGNDNINYSWRAANVECINCHTRETGEWSKSAHAQVLKNRYFETMYEGTSVTDPVIRPTSRQVFDNDLVRVPLVNDLNYHGPGFQLDFPNQTGNCSYCHAPAAVPSSNQSVDLNPFFSNYNSTAGEGITCDVCHKVFNIALDNDNYPFLDRPGIMSFKFLRSENINLHFGPFLNISNRSPLGDNRKSICSPVFNSSEFCAACHYAEFGKTMIYSSYGEWRLSKYGVDPDSSDFRTCQDCHMPRLDLVTDLGPFSKREGCTEGGTQGVERSHNLMNVVTVQNVEKNVLEEIPSLIRGAAEIVELGFLYQPAKKNSLGVVVTVENKKAGHKFPTDSPLRHLILIIEAKDRQGMSLIQTDGEVIPTWGGIGININGMENYGGKAGKIFAYLLKEKDTNISPTAAYWNPTELAWVDLENKITSDNRLVPNDPDKSEYYFTTPTSGDVTVNVKLIYRYAFIELAARKGWTRPDIVVASWECNGPPKEVEKIVCKEKVTYSP